MAKQEEEKKKKVLQGPEIPEQPNYAFGLGWVLKHISGVEGYVCYRVDNISGCNQYGIQPMATADTKPDTFMFDEMTLVDTGARVTLPVWATKKNAIVETPGGLSQPIRHTKIK